MPNFVSLDYIEFMKDKKVLNISSEVVPYLPQTNQAINSFKIPKNINDHGGQTRIFMPRYGKNILLGTQLYHPFIGNSLNNKKGI